MLRKGLIGVSVFSQVLLVGFMAFVIHSNKSKPEIIEDIFIETKNYDREISSAQEMGSMSQEAEAFNIPYKFYIESTGVVVPVSGYVKVTNPMSGKVAGVFVKVGDLVEKSAPLFKICDNSVQVQIKQKEANLNKSIAELKFIQNGPSVFAKLKKQKEIEEIQIKKASQEKEVSIFKSLLEKSAVSALENEEKHMFLQITEKTLEKVKAEYDELNAEMTSDEECIYLSEIEEKKADLKLSTLKLESTLVESPIAGRIVDIEVSSGQYLKEKGNTYMTVASEAPATIKVSIDENDAYKIIANKNLRAVAVHPENPEIYFILDFVSLNHRMSIYKGDVRKLDLFFTFQKDQTPVYLEQSLKVYIETSSLNDLSFLHYKFK